MMNSVVDGFLPPRHEGRGVEGRVEGRDGGKNNDLLLVSVEEEEEDDEWESVDVMRRRLGIVYNYKPDLLNPELCRYLTEVECQRANDAMRKHATKMRNLPKFAASKNVTTMTTASSAIDQPPPPQQQEKEKEKGQRRKLDNPSVGSVKILVLLVQFPDHMDRELVDPTVYNDIWNSNAKSEIIPSGSVSRWIELNSYGLYEIQANIMPWTVTDNTESYYSFGISGRTMDFQQAFWPALDYLDQQGIDWSNYDVDGDGVLDAVVALHSGYAAELKGLDCNTKQDYSQRIWSHAFAATDYTWTSADGVYSLGGYVAASAYKGICGNEPANIGTMTHEFMHTFGLVGEFLMVFFNDFFLVSQCLSSHGVMLVLSRSVRWPRRQGRARCWWL